MIIMKFGGSSVGNADRIRSVKQIVSNYLSEKPIIVCSAMGKTTDQLLLAGQKALLNGIVDCQEIITSHLTACEELKINPEIIKDLLVELEQLLIGIKQIREISPRTKDYLVSFGERLAVRVIATSFNQEGLKAKFFDSWEIGIKTNNKFMEASLLPDAYDQINQYLGFLKTDYQFTPVITGFIGQAPCGSITTFGRGGSDLTSSILGAALEVNEIQVWKDVDGLMTADPRKVPNAIPVNKVSFEEASELSYFGAKVLHPLSMMPAKEKGITVRVKNSYNPEAPGTIITSETDYSLGPVKSITSKNNITLIDIVSSKLLGAVGFVSKVFNAFEKFDISVDVLASSEVSISLTVDQHEDLEKLVAELSEFASVRTLPNHSIVSLICNAQNSSLILSDLFLALAKEKLNPKMLSQGASKLNISLVFEEQDADRALNIAHSSLLNLRN